MAGDIKGVTIEFRGDVTPLQKAINQVRRESKELDKELKAIDRSLKFNPTSVDLWRQKQEVLKKQIAQTKDNLNELKAAQKKLDADGVDRSSAEYRELEREIIKTENQLKKLNAELKQIPTASIRAAAEAMKGFGDKAKKAGKTMTTYFTAPIIAGYTAASKYASDYEENLNKIDVAFGDSSESVKEWANNARDAFGMSRVQATSAASAFGALGKGIGLSESDAAEMSTTLTGLSADLGSYFNMSNEDSAKALEGIFTGEAEALKKFGVVMNDTNLQKFAEDQGLVWKELDQSEKTMLRYQFVLANTKDAQGDFARTSDGTANSLKIFQAAVQDLGTSIGTVLLPIITPIIQKAAELINKFNELDPRTQKIITYIGIAVAAIGPLLMVIGTLSSAIGNLLIFGPMIISTVAPVILIIGALVAAGVLLYKNWDVIKAKAIQIKDQLVATWNNIKTKVLATVENIKSRMSAAWDSMRSKAAAAFEAIKQKIIAPIQNAYNTVRGWIEKLKKLFPLSVGKIFSNLKIPHIDVSGGKAPFGIGGLGTKPSISVSWHAQGGIFASPTLLAGRNGLHGVGEAGAEAIIPLDELWRHMEDLNGGITINVYGNANASAADIAAEVERRLIAAQKRRRMAWQ